MDFLCVLSFLYITSVVASVLVHILGCWNKETAVYLNIQVTDFLRHIMCLFKDFSEKLIGLLQGSLPVIFSLNLICCLSLSW